MTKTTRLGACAALLLTLPLQGCLYISTAGTFGPYLDPEVVDGIVPGETTKADVLRLLGPPAEFLRSEVVDSLADQEVRIAGGVGLGNRARDVFSYQQDQLSGWSTLLILFNRVRADVESNLLLVFFDPDDRVREVSFRTLERKR